MAIGSLATIQDSTKCFSDGHGSLQWQLTLNVSANGLRDDQIVVACERPDGTAFEGFAVSSSLSASQFVVECPCHGLLAVGSVIAGKLDVNVGLSIGQLRGLAQVTSHMNAHLLLSPSINSASQDRSGNLVL